MGLGRETRMKFVKLHFRNREFFRFISAELQWKQLVNKTFLQRPIKIVYFLLANIVNVTSKNFQLFNKTPRPP